MIDGRILLITTTFLRLVPILRARSNRYLVYYRYASSIRILLENEGVLLFYYILTISETLANGGTNYRKHSDLVLKVIIRIGIGLRKVVREVNLAT